MKIFFAVLATLLAIAGNIPYIVEVFRKKVRPHPYTWLIWSIVSLINFFGQLSKGAGIGTIPTAAAEIFTIIIFVFSLRYGFRQITRIDHIFLSVALLSLVPWIMTSDPTISIILVVAIDVVAFIPTLRKTWTYPDSESHILYSTNTLRHILSLFSLEAYNLATTLHSIAMITTNATMTTIMLLKKRS